MKEKLIKILKETLEDDTYIPESYFKPKTKTANNSENKIENKAGVSESEKKSKSTKPLMHGGSENKITLLKKLEEEVKKCRKCPLGYSRINAVFGVGNPDARVMFVGEGPGYEEDHRGEPFVGRAGQLLDKILASINLSREIVYIANIVKCHPMINSETPEARGNDRPPTPEEISACRGYLEEQIKIIKPEIIVTLGNTATRFMLQQKLGVSKLRGRVYDMPKTLTLDLDIKIIPTYHPAALLRNPSLKRETWEDVKMLRRLLDGK